MKSWKSTLFLFLSVFVLYAVYMWFVKETHDVSRLLLESVLFSGVLTVISTVLDVLRSRFNR